MTVADPRFFAKRGPFALKELAERCEARLAGGSDGSAMVAGVGSLESAGPADIVYMAAGRLRNGAAATDAVDPKIKAMFDATKAGFAIVADGGPVPPGVGCLLSKNPARSFALASAVFHPAPVGDGTVHASASIAPSARLGKSVSVGPFAVIGENAEIGDFSLIEAHACIGPGVRLGAACRVGTHASVTNCVAGSKVIIYPGARIGQSGFGFVFSPPDFAAMPQLGNVVIGDDVEIGANSCVDRGHLEDTVIGSGTRIDNLVMIAHNVRVGAGCVLVSQTGIAGSAHLEDFVVAAGQAGIAGHVTIGKGAKIGAQAGIMRDVPAGAEVMGTPAVPARRFFRQTVTLERLSKSRTEAG